MDMAQIKCNKPHMRFLKQIRELQGLTQYGMAKKLGLIVNTYVHYETKAKGINLEVLSAIRQKLGLSWSDLGKMIDEEVKNKKEKL